LIKRSLESKEDGNRKKGGKERKEGRKKKERKKERNKERNKERKSVIFRQTTVCFIGPDNES